ncbi:hypothetical protein CC86DRAFT_380204 [Ophiobolus disseminans]|uniref:Zn(2)-C6 fungal-type domain-containing protein n=1 Tax=Ophiobolus disseminans TaxID=1469910 RepID=A0A6A7A8A0_9PLEO|nr:hypothetical protein CC86DRAFT_380204 [Ophiobolus disseminans]
MPSSRSSSVLSHESRAEAKRRKIRKGTRSCWECKRRKMKCVLDPLAGPDSNCQGCQRRGSPCVSQAFPWDVSQSSGAGAAAHIHGKQMDSDAPDSNCSNGFATPASTTSDHSLRAGGTSEFSKTTHGGFTHTFTASEVWSNSQMLSYYLHDSLPSLEETKWILEASKASSNLALRSLMVPYSAFEGIDGETACGPMKIPGRTAHPVLIARHMLQLAACLHHLHSNTQKEVVGSQKSRRDLMERLADTAIRLVTTNDDLLGSIEGLQCVMIESIYHVNKGNLRRSWVTCRRAFSIAQLMGLSRSASQAQYKVLDPETQYSSQHMWFRMVGLERHLCLMMGLPQGCLDRSMASDLALAGDTPMGRLERMHCVLASRILERNESALGSDNRALTRDLDLDIQKAARTFPSKWWLPPSLIVDSTESQDLFWEARRLFAHVFHYSLVLQLHMPYMLHFTSDQGVCDYSRITCVNASREVISRFITLRSSNRIALDCRTIDFFALMAAMTLLIAHLDGHRIGAGNLLAHQYLSDRAMIEQVQDCMEKLHRLNRDALSAQSADLLRRLLAMEAKAVSGEAMADAQSTDASPLITDEDSHVSVDVTTPYYNIIKIAREGIRRHRPMPSSDSAQSATLVDDDEISMSTVYQATMSNGARWSEADMDFSQIQVLPTETFLHDDWCSSTRADCHDSAFQGVDLAFFDNLMRTSGSDDNLDCWLTQTQLQPASTE